MKRIKPLIMEKNDIITNVICITFLQQHCYDIKVQTAIFPNVLHLPLTGIVIFHLQGVVTRDEVLQKLCDHPHPVTAVAKILSFHQKRIKTFIWKSRKFTEEHVCGYCSEMICAFYFYSFQEVASNKD